MRNDMNIKKIILAAALLTSFSCFAAQQTPAPVPVPQPTNGQTTPATPVAKPSMADYCKEHTC